MENFLLNYNETNYNNYLNNPMLKDEIEIDDKENFLTHFYTMLKDCVNKYDVFDSPIPKNKNYFINLYKETPNYKFSNHIIIIGTLNNLMEISSILRKFTKKPVVFFSQADFITEKWEKLRKRDNLYYYMGSYANVSHLEYLQIESCFKIVILPTEEPNKLFSDSDTIVVTRIIRDKYPLADLVIEFEDDNSLRLLDKRPTSRNPNYLSHYNYNFWPNVINGSVFLNSLFYVFFSKNIYDCNLLKFIKEISGVHDAKSLMRKKRINFSLSSNFETRPKTMFHTLTINLEMINQFRTYGRLVWYILKYVPDIIPLGIEKSKDLTFAFLSDENKKEKRNRVTIASGSKSIFSSPNPRKPKKNSNKKSQFLYSFTAEKVNMSSWTQNVMVTNPSLDIFLNENDKLFVMGDIRKIKKSFEENSDYSNFAFPKPETNYSYNENNYSEILSFSSEIQISSVPKNIEAKFITQNFNFFDTIMSSKIKNLEKILENIKIEDIKNKLQDKQFHSKLMLKLETEEVLNLAIKTKKKLLDYFNCYEEVEQDN